MDLSGFWSADPAIEVREPSDRRQKGAPASTGGRIESRRRNGVFAAGR
jgi:hypothetical protein